MAFLLAETQDGLSLYMARDWEQAGVQRALGLGYDPQHCKEKGRGGEEEMGT